MIWKRGKVARVGAAGVSERTKTEMIATVVYSHTRSGSSDSPTKAWEMAAEKACANQNIPVTKPRMFLGAFVKAYSRPVIDAPISENAISTYAGVCHRHRDVSMSFKTAFPTRVILRRYPFGLAVEMKTGDALVQIELEVHT